MIVRVTGRLVASLLTLSTAIVVPSAPAGAKEESKIQIRLLPAGGGGGNGNGVGQGQARGDVRSQLQGSTARLQIHVRGVEPGVEHVLLSRQDELDAAGIELARFTTDGNGAFNGTVDLHRLDDSDARLDPRGRYLVVSDGSQDLLAGWLYAAVEDDGPMTKVKEQTRLSPDAAVLPSGSFDARYDRRPNGNGTFQVTLRSVPAGEYLLFVDGVEVASVTPNAAGNAVARYTTKPPRGAPKSKPHNRKGSLDFDPRRKLVELRQGTQPYFSGPMLAQISGVNSCPTGESVTPLALGPEQTEGSGRVVIAVEGDCETSVEVEVEDLPAASYDLYVDGMLVGQIDVTDARAGTLSGRIDFDPTPDHPDEVPLEFAIGSGAVFDVHASGADPAFATPLLSATLP